MPWVNRRVSLVDNYLVDDWFQDEKESKQPKTRSHKSTKHIRRASKYRNVETRTLSFDLDEAKNTSRRNSVKLDTSGRNSKRRRSLEDNEFENELPMVDDIMKDFQNAQVFEVYDDEINNSSRSLYNNNSSRSLYNKNSISTPTSTKSNLSIQFENNVSNSRNNKLSTSYYKNSIDSSDNTPTSNKPQVQRFVDYEEYNKMKERLQSMAELLSKSQQKTVVQPKRNSKPPPKPKRPPPKAKKRVYKPPPKKVSTSTPTSNPSMNKSRPSNETNKQEKKQENKNSIETSVGGMDSIKNQLALKLKKNKTPQVVVTPSDDKKLNSNGNNSNNSKNSNSLSNDILNDPKMKKYIKMKKINMPMASIINRMRMDKIPQDMIDKFSGKKKAVKKVVKQDFSKHPKLKKYAMLQKLGTPLHAIVNRMKVDGVDKELIDLFNNNGKQSLLSDNDSEKKRQPSWIFEPKKNTSKKLKGIHWQKVEYDPDGGKDTIWEGLHKQTAKNVKLDSDELNDLFELKTKFVKKNDEDTKKSKNIQLLDGKRSFNISIGLSKIGLKDFEIREALLSMNDKILHLELLEKLKPYMPTNKELEILRRFNGDVTKLDRPEKFFLSLLDFSDLQQRLNLWTFKIQFDELVAEVSSRVDLVNLTLDRIKNCKSLKNILAAILSIGNYINNGTHRGKAFGFKLSSIEILDKTRTSNGKMTLLMYVVKTVEKNFPDSLHVHQELGILEDTVRIQQGHLKDTLDEIINNTKLLQSKMRSHRQSVAFGMSQHDILSLQTTAKDILGVNNYKKMPDMFDDVMQDFLIHALDESDNIKKKFKTAVEKTQKTLKFFGESKTLKWEQLFAIIKKFAFLFEKAKQEVHKMELREKKARQKRLQKTKEINRQRKESRSGKRQKSDKHNQKNSKNGKLSEKSNNFINTKNKNMDS